MRKLAAAAVLAVTLAGAAHAESPGCRPTLDGGERCKQEDGHVTETRPDGQGGVRKTSTNPRHWEGSDGLGGGVTPPDSMIRNDPMLRRDWWGRVTDPWEPRRSTPGPTIEGEWRAERW